MNPDTERAAEREAQSKRALEKAESQEAGIERLRALNPDITRSLVYDLTIEANALRCWAAVLAPSDIDAERVAKAIADVIGHCQREKCGPHADAAIAALRECAATPADAAATERGA